MLDREIYYFWKLSELDPWEKITNKQKYPSGGEALIKCIHTLPQLLAKEMKHFTPPPKMEWPTPLPLEYDKGVNKMCIKYNANWRK